MTKSLSIIYTFLPYVDTAGIVFAKRMQAEIKESMTVISCKAYNGASRDDSLQNLVSPYLDKLIELDAKFTYRDWGNFEDFYNKALNAYRNEIDNGSIFDKIYSRSMSVISHLVAYKIKCLNPNIKWIAEFSDPIIKDVTGDERETIIPDEWLLKNIEINELKDFRQYNNLFSLSEILVYLYADEIKFTNKLQKDFMTKYFLSDILNKNIVRKTSELVDKKSIISAHPILEKKFYQLHKFDSSVISKNFTNIAYFGNINSKRSFNAFFDSWLELDLFKQDRIRFYIYSNLKKETILKNVPERLQSYVIVEKGLPYLEFLNSMQYFDYLLTVDTEVNDIFGVNPFLPSKLSDYLGSGTKVLALVEDGSPTTLLESNLIFKKSFDNFKISEILEV